MLAYVFWHWRQSTVEKDAYEAGLIQFHRTLGSTKPTGFRGSTVFLLDSASWLATNTSAYEEWYLLDDSAAMDRINHAAVNGPCEEPHNFVARYAAGGIGGLYRLRAGLEQLGKSNFATWISKPGGVSYRDFDAQLQPIVSENHATMWSRQMTLGPTTEFCLHSSSPLELDAEFGGVTLPLALVWTGQS
jgi:hypothetical protein